ncbi:MAG: cytidylate kinase-like family protein [Bacteroidales bacterium]|jgi:cytidylate kinase|nr:cytidylate kinase-like family protein [Bacteroidales bacterium]
MKNTIINVGRQFGSGGGFVAKAIGRKLGIPVYDNELISKAAEESGYSKSVFEGGEKRKSLFSMSSFFASGRLPFGESSGYINDDMLFKIQSDVIRNIAEKGDAIIVGRCADYILRDLDCLDVFVCAPMDYRVQRLVKNEGLDPEEAEELMRRKDRTREAYYNFYTFGSWGVASNYDLCVDSSILGIEGTADFVIDFGRRAGKIR